jgi:protein-arginine kinase activator protein McsA
MICSVCHKHATLEHTLWQGTVPHQVKLCADCNTKVGGDDHIARIKSAGDKTAKKAAVEAFLKAVGK